MWPQPLPTAPPPRPRIEGWSSEDPSAPVPPHRRRRRGRWLLAAAAVTAAVVITALLAGRHAAPVAVGGNGESTKDVQQILDDSALAFSKAQSFHVTGRVVTQDETDVYDLRVGSGGTQGTVLVDGSRLDVIVIGEDAYLHGRQFFETYAGPDAANLIGDKWVPVKTDDPKLGPHLQIVSVSGVQQLISQLAVDNPLDKGGTTQIDGAKVITLSGEGVEVDVALDGKPYPRLLRGSHGATHVDLRFGDFDKPQAAPQKPVDIYGESQRLSL